MHAAGAPRENGPRPRARGRRGVVLAALIAVGVLTAPAVASAGPVWRMDSFSNSTVPAGGTLTYLPQATNIGDAATASPLTFVVSFGPGVTGLDVQQGGACSGDGPGAAPGIVGASTVTCTFAGAVQSHRAYLPQVTASVAPGASGVVKTSFEVSGGDAPAAADATDPTRIGPELGFGIDAFDAQVNDASGGPFTQAGGHPFSASTSIDFNSLENPAFDTFFPGAGVGWPAEPTKDVTVDLPPGFVANPAASAKCAAGDLAGTGGITPRSGCAPTAQVGTAIVRFNGFGAPNAIGPIPVYNLVSPPSVPARFGFNVAGTVVTFDGRLRSDSDYGLTADVRNISQGLAVASTTLTLWGVPADPSHDSERACTGVDSPFDPFSPGPSCPSGAPRVAFLRNPTSCTATGVGLPTKLSIDSWVHPGAFVTSTIDSHLPPAYPSLPSDWGAPQGPTGCDKVPFTPTLTGAPEAGSKAASPAGFAFDVSLPQSDDPNVVGEADLKKAVVTLPAGVRIGPGAADGLQGCTSQQIGLHSTDDPTCPDGSKVGTVVIKTPLLDDPVAGSVYLATPHDNPFGSLVAIYLVAKGPGVIIKLPGKVALDPSSGQVTATFDNNPQLPFTNLHLQFQSGPRAQLVLPDRCGTFMTHAELTPWSSDTPVSIDTPMIVDGNCDPGPFAPAFRAGTVTPVAGAHTPFTLSVDNNQPVRTAVGRIDTVLPKGLLGQISSVAQCPEDRAAAGTCEAGSQIGSVTLKAGAGEVPYSLPGAGKAPTAVYLAGPYKGAPFSLSIVVPAQAGPFDLGTVVTRAALYVDPITAQVTVKSDPLPTIIDGIPATLANVSVNVDRPGFIFNPTNCDPASVDGSVTPVNGATGSPVIDGNGVGVPTAFGDPVAVSNRFQLAGCGDLDLAPKLAIALTGKGQTTDDKHPAVVASLTQPAGQANLKKVSVSLPLSLALDPDNANGLCEFADGSKVEPTCPQASIVGTATARTPILSQPLTGPVYFVKNIRKDPKSGRDIRTLPKLVIPLTGENGVRLNVTGTSSVVGGRLVTTFDNLPDAPVSSFTLNIAGGKHGILVVSGADICKATQVADQQVDGQNGKIADAAITLATPACGLKILSKKIGKRSITLKVSGLGAGKVTVSGKGIKKTSRTIKAATVATVTARRTGHGRPSGVKVSFTPQGSHKPIATTVSLRSAHAVDASLKESK
jgi:hypothetical protein